ncbi:MAG: hypothetical protein NTY36_05775 [Deltaproteobacteria bacterium]|nr:hypothetical protein [Deltaproteobacteria bacterium]
MYKFIFSALHCQVSRLPVVKKSTNPGRLAIIKQFRAFYQLFKVKDNGNSSVAYSPFSHGLEIPISQMHPCLSAMPVFFNNYNYILNFLIKFTTLCPKPPAARGPKKLAASRGDDSYMKPGFFAGDRL